MIRFNVYLPQVQIDALRALSAASGIAFAELIRRAVDCYLREPDVTRPLLEHSADLKESQYMAMSLTTIPLAAITERIDARAIHPHGVAALRKKMELLGFLPQFPILVSTKPDGTYRLLDGAHRVEAAQRAGLTEASALVREPCADLLEEVALARASNEASETNVQTTLIDDAELVWRLAGPYTQIEIGKALGWTQQQVGQYACLQKIDDEAWRVITTTFSHGLVESHEDIVVKNTTVVVSPFTENLLRDILDLLPAQQLELCAGLANGALKKSAFTTRAKAYKARNAAAAWVTAQLGAMEEDLLSEALHAVATGQYDDEWQRYNGPGPKLLARAIRPWKGLKEMCRAGQSSSPCKSDSTLEGIERQR